MKLHNYSDSELSKEITLSKHFLEDLQRALECIPENSILGRLGIEASLTWESKRYNKLLDEAKRRGLR